jgi:hypothetical protein
VWQLVARWENAWLDHVIHDELPIFTALHQAGFWRWGCTSTNVLWRQTSRRVVRIFSDDISRTQRGLAQEPISVRLWCNKQDIRRFIMA